MTNTFPDKRILVLTPDLPYPCIGGGRRRMASILDALGSLATVHIAARARLIPEETREWCARHRCSIHAVDTGSDRTGRRIATRIRQIVSGDWQSWDRRERLLLEGEFTTFKPDIVWVEASYQVRYALSWRGRAGVVVDFWGTSEGAQRILSRTRGVTRLWHRYHCAMARCNERAQVPQMSAAVVVSDHCARHLRSVTGGGVICVVPTARDDANDGSDCARAADPTTIILSGVMSFEPNVDAACWFVKDIFPWIRRRFPGAKVVIAGASPTSGILALSVPGVVEVTGEVPDLRERIAAAAVYALPMRLGSGIRTKLLDVFPLETPIVTTSIGAEGFDLRNEESALIADDAEVFAQACIRMLEDRDLAARIGGAAKRLANERYTRHNVRDQVALVLERCFGKRQEQAVS